MNKIKLKIIRLVMKCPILDGPLSNFKWYRNLVINVAMELIREKVEDKK